MNSTFRNVMSNILAFVLVFNMSTFGTFSHAAQAEEPTSAAENFSFDTTTQTITGYKGERPENLSLQIPEKIKVEGTEYPVLAIGDNAFSAAQLGYSLESVAIPEGIKRIGAHSFEGNALTNFNIPASLQSIGDYAFAQNQKNESETQFIVPKNSQLSTIGAYAFDTCNLGRVDVSNMRSRASIGESAFEHNNISNLTFSNDTFDVIGKRAFAANNLSQVATLKANTLGEGAFYDNGRYVVLGATNVTNDVKMGHFGSVTKPTSIYVRGVLKDDTDTTVLSTTKVSFDATKEKPYDELLLKSKAGSETIITAPFVPGYKSVDNDVHINLETQNNGATEGNPLVFKFEPENHSASIKGLSTLNLEIDDTCDKSKLLEGVKAFSADGADITANIKINPESIDTSYAHSQNVVYEVTDAFGNTCTETRMINVAIDPAKIETGNGWLMEDFVFEGDKVVRFSSFGLKKGKTNHKVVFPSVNPYEGIAIKSINSGSRGMFDYPTKITEVVVPEGVESINAFAFNSKNLIKVSLPSTLKEIGNNTFNSCSNLNHIDLPDSVERIGDSAFRSTGLTDIVLPNNLKVI